MSTNTAFSNDNAMPIPHIRLTMPMPTPHNYWNDNVNANPMQVISPCPMVYCWIATWDYLLFVTEVRKFPAFNFYHPIHRMEARKIAESPRNSNSLEKHFLPTGVHTSLTIQPQSDNYWRIIKKAQWHKPKLRDILLLDRTHKFRNQIDLFK
jgi:hypothetical protein